MNVGQYELGMMGLGNGSDYYNVCIPNSVYGNERIGHQTKKVTPSYIFFMLQLYEQFYSSKVSNCLL